jgi:hypothetical protein
MNDAESHTLYWVDMPDFASSIEDIQIQRGAGTSTNGAGAFGGSINMKTESISALPYAEVTVRMVRSIRIRKLSRWEPDC